MIRSLWATASLAPTVNFDAPPWLVDFLDSVSVWDAVVWGAVVVAGVWFIYKKGWQSVIAFARGLVNAAEILASVQGLPAYIERADARAAAADARHDRLEGKVDGIYHETHNNDGSSVKDSVDRIELGVKGLYGRIDTVENKVVALGEADEELRAELEDTRNPKETS